MTTRSASGVLVFAVFLVGAGRAEAQVSAKPAALDFPDAMLGAPGQPLDVTLHNSGAGGVTINLAIVGSNPQDFVEVGGLGGGGVQIAGMGDFPVSIAFAPTGSGMRTAILRVQILGGGVLDVPLRGRGLGPTVSVDGGPIDLGGTRIGGVIAPRAITVRNRGGGMLVVRGVALVGGQAAAFNLAPPPLPVTLGPGQAAEAQLGFGGNAPGLAATTLRILSDDPNTPTLDVAVRASAGDPLAGLDIGAIAFGSARVGTTTAWSTALVRNNGLADLTVNGVRVVGANPGDFLVDDAAIPRPPMRIAPGQTAALRVAFKPLGLGARGADVIIDSDAVDAPNLALRVFGAGTLSMLAVVPAMEAFGQVRLYQSSAPRSIAIVNAGTGAASIQSIAFVGPRKEWFRFAGASPVVPKTIPAMGRVTIDVVAVPLALGPGAAMLEITTDDAKAPLLAAGLTVEGVGPLVAVNPPFADFGAVGFNVQARQSITIENTGTDALAIEGFELASVSGAFTIAGGPMPGDAIAPGAKVSFELLFKPQALGADGAELTLTTDAPQSRIIRVPFSGAGTMGTLTVTPAMLAFGVVAEREASAPQKLRLANTGGSVVSIRSLAIEGAAAGMFALDDKGPFELAPMGARDVYLTYAPVGAGSHTAVIVVTPDNLPVARAQVSGVSVIPLAQVAGPGGATSLDFGDVPVGTQAEQAFAIRNASAIAFELALPRSTDAQFVVTAARPLSRLAPMGVAQGLTVRFTPRTEGPQTAMVEVVTTAGHVVGAIRATGAGVKPAVRRPPYVPGPCSVGGGAGHRAAPRGAALIVVALGGLLARRRIRSRSAR